MMVINCNSITHLDGYTNGVNVLKFAIDADGNKIVGVEVLNDPAFEAIHAQLSAQPLIEFIPQNIEI